MEDGLRTRSFRDEDHNYRRIFLRSYPLQWGDENGEDEKKAQKRSSSVKSRLTALFQLSDSTVILLKRLKKKVVFYSTSCHTFGFKSSNKVLSV
ncbi:hypothetical protein Cni_G25956 [Canna indica]|uniref:Uncharacterized protein n=1 Tax=Canna indica TaxID=4628 RepID=A0AAQ3L137_9LILI|nr:hypothetical protein Cni_G25956 [Canna indica]